jgi:CheY-like chemotaxis protein
MAHIRLIHWNAAEGDERAAELRRAGYEVDCQAAFGPLDLRPMRERPPEAFVIDLGRTPSQGRDVALALRQQKATRAAPLVFVEGDPEKTARVRQLLPDAFYTPWPDVGRTLERALRQPPAKPLTPGVLAGYSGTPLPKKLGIRAGALVALLGAPEGFEDTLGTLPEGVRIARTGRGRPQLILLFAKSRAGLERRFPVAARILADGGGIWIVWPKKASGVVTDLGENEVRGFGLAVGFVDYKVCAVDQTWSGLLFARRRKLLRHKENR